MPSLSVKPKISYAESIKYFEENETDISNNDCEDIKTILAEDSHIEVKKREKKYY